MLFRLCRECSDSWCGRWTRTAWHTAWLYCPAQKQTRLYLRSEHHYVRLNHPPHTHLCATEQLNRKPRNRLLEADRKDTARMKRVFFFSWLTWERNKCAEKRRRPSRPAKPISITSTGTQTLLYNSGEEVDAGSAELALPTLPPPFNQGVLSETEIPVGKLLKHLFSLFVFFPPV